MSDYSWITDEMFDEKIRELADKHGWEVPGVFEIVREFYNNAALDELEQEKDEN